MLHSADTYRIRPVSVLIQDSNYQRDDRTELERLRRSKFSVYTQDRELHYTSLSNSFLGSAIDDIIGCTDDQVFSGGAGAALTALKREVIDSGQSKRGEIAIDD